MKRFDAIVVGGGPAGSTTAYRLADAGASVLLVDKAIFPRDKACGGGLTTRAVRWCPVDPTPVVEDVVDALEIRFRFGDAIVRRSSEAIVWMTQRRRLDAFLLDAARERGVEVHEGTTLDVARAPADVIVGADGANGTTARALGLGKGITHGLAYEGNVSYSTVPQERYTRRAVLEIADIPGGYGWVFPKGDHANVGVGCWPSEGPRIREHLARVCAAHGLDRGQLEHLRGHRLPMRGSATRIANERALLVGDAGGLVDPITGDGMYECFVSSKLAARAILDLLAGRARTLEPYEAAIDAAVAPLHHASLRLKHAVDRWPRASWRIARLSPTWRIAEGVLLGDLSAPGEQRGMAKVPLWALGLLGR